MRLVKKISVVTGASRGIGRAVAIRFAREGAIVVAVARNADLLQGLQDEVNREGLKVETVQANLSSSSVCEEILSGVIEKYGKIDALVNNAGILGLRVPIVQITPSEWDMVIATNLSAVFYLSRLAAKQMMKQHSGSIINVTSGVVPKPRPNWGAYLPSKFAVEGLTLMMSDELRDYGIRVNMIDPGGVRTEMRASAFPDEDPSTLKTPEEVTEPFVFLASDEFNLITGARLKLK
ncbi:MAG: SDR family NAD(P)-dependent oxidoreductase [Candidatus Kryptoniota bacterium]